MQNYIQSTTTALAQLLPDCDPTLLSLYGLLALTKGTGTTLEDVHEAWAIWRNLTNPAHKSLVPFDELTTEVQELDRPYMEAIHQAVFLASAV